MGASTRNHVRKKGGGAASAKVLRQECAWKSVWLREVRRGR